MAFINFQRKPDTDLSATLQEVGELLENAQKSYFDQTVNIKQVTHSENGDDAIIVANPDNGSTYLSYQRGSSSLELRCSSHALSQILGRLKIPGDYFHTCPGKLKAANFNHWTSINKKEWLLRFFMQGDATQLRGVLSSLYKKLDDIDVFQRLKEVLEIQEQKTHIQSFSKDPFVSRMIVSLPTLAVTSEGQTITAQVSITNSEVGLWALTIAPSVSIDGTYTFVDLNKEGATSIHHIGKDPLSGVKEALNKAIDAAQAGIVRIIQLQKEGLVETKGQLAIIRETMTLEKAMLDSLEEEFGSKLELQRLEVAKSILNLVKDLPLIRKFEIECKVGQYLDLFGDINARIKDLFE